MKINLKMAVIIAAAAVLTACGSSDDAPAKVATTDTVVQASASTTAAAVSVPFVFPAGVPELGTTGATTVAFTSTTTTPNFTIDVAGVGTASGTTTFGSCILRITASTFTAPHPLAVGSVITINPCALTVNTTNLLTGATAIPRDVFLTFGLRRSNAGRVNVSVNADGVVTVNGVTVGTVPTGTVTGGSS